MKLCSCGHILWLTAGVRACGACDLMGRWPRVNGTADTRCRHCGRGIVLEDGVWIDPEATGDDAIWRETCDAHDTFTAEHEPRIQGVDRTGQTSAGNPPLEQTPRPFDWERD